MSSLHVEDLHGRRILVLEDEYYIADDVAKLLEGLGAEVVGPIADLGDAHALLEREASIDLAVLDINLQGDLVYSVATLLQQRGIPIIFATGYDSSILPTPYRTVPRLQKPFENDALQDLILRTFEDRRSPRADPGVAS